MTASVDLNNPAERERLRSHVVGRLGFVPDRPVVTVFNHAVSDALGTNRELFASLADWFADTAAYAAEHPEAQWLFLDHPSQALYDSTGFFDSVAAAHRRSKHLAFRPSATLSKNALWSLTDLGVTVRGSVSNELPAYGIPVIQAGWSEWSSCGLSTVVDDRDAYFKTLEQGITAIRDGADLVTEEQVRRARLWLWLYRSGTDVVTPLVPQWEVWLSRRAAQDDARDVPAHRGRRRPALHRGRADVDPAGADADPDGPLLMIGTWFATDYDVAPTAIELPADVAGGREDGVCVVDQVVRGTGIVGRVSGDHGAVGLKVISPGVATRVTVVVHLDELATRWWSDRVRPQRFAPEQPRLVLIRAQGELRGAALLCRPQGLRRAGGAKAAVSFDLTAGELDGDGLLMVELAEPPRPPWVAGRLAARSALGVRIDQISVRAQPPTPADDGAPDPTGCDLALLTPNPPERFRLEVTAVPPRRRCRAPRRTGGPGAG
nr:hypothetical protein GCM10020092_102850 [Actinoplanes digitatis]